MQKQLFALFAFILTTNAHAVPAGCFVTDTSTYCYTGSFLASDCDQWNMTSYYFGTYVSSMCSYVNTVEAFALGTASSLDKCNADFKTVVSQRDTCANEKNTCVALAADIEKNRQEWIAYAQGRDAVIKKMQKACGAKCRRIK